MTARRLVLAAAWAVILALAPAGVRIAAAAPPDAGVATAAPRFARVIKLEMSEGTTLIVISIGADQGVTTAWTATLVGDGDAPLDRGELTFVRVDAHSATASVRLDPHVVQTHPRVRLLPPRA